MLWIGASERVYAKELSNTYRGEDNDLVAYQNVANSYLISVFANLLRLEAFNKLNEDEIQEQKNEEEDKEKNGKS